MTDENEFLTQNEIDDILARGGHSPKPEERSDEQIPAVVGCAVYTKDQVIRIVAEFARSYNTDAFLGNGETIEEAIEKVRDLIKFDI